MDLMNTYPSIPYLEQQAQRRIPFFAWEYLASGTGREVGLADNIAALQRIKLTPRMLAGRFVPDTKTELFGKTYDVPFGAAPVGMSGLLWPGAERILAAAAKKQNFAYCLSTVACESPETIGEIAGDNGWFQLYPLKDGNDQKDLLERAWNAGIRTLAVTVDIPIGSRRERQLRAGLVMPPPLTPLTLWRVARRPHWAFATLSYGMPRFRALEKYMEPDAIGQPRRPADFFDGLQDWDLISRVRDLWKGAMVVKGIMHPDDADNAIAAGADGIVVSNHGARQLDGAPASIEVLPTIAAAVGGKTKILFDSGIRGGLDIIRALSLGADFCLMGRAFIFAVAALGDKGADHAAEILRLDLTNNMYQLGARSLADLPAYAPAGAHVKA
jgi:L-lactate dehydrogenase (cytochrome)